MASWKRTQLQFETSLRPSLMSGVINLRLGQRGTNYYGSFRLMVTTVLNWTLAHRSLRLGQLGSGYLLALITAIAPSTKRAMESIASRTTPR
ncbi:MAG: hypothetical protein F6K28_50145 [Microcoleus sp. SIO2G3]|nr:hypothetical protein [Microcoleus sp. SIO2G3]